MPVGRIRTFFQGIRALHSFLPLVISREPSVFCIYLLSHDTRRILEQHHLPSVEKLSSEIGVVDVRQRNLSRGNNEEISFAGDIAR
ncbi:MAG: hypothetical protein Q8O97_01805, partial [bacterium]|nr:hypothetical protein [bacterium]